jgi:tRNA pseudouridine55 synthase
VIDGLLVVDKPPGMTSHDVVGRCRRIFGQRRVGHAGTLDPGATGLLLVGLGRATRLLQFLSGLPKTYRAEVVLGVATSTLDDDGEETGRWDMRHITLDDVRRAAARLTGDIQQVPPMVSAVKIGGRRLHQLARGGVEVTRPARSVTVMRFDIEAGVGAAGERAAGVGAAAEQGAGPVFAVEVECSSGTFVRSLAADLGAQLGGGAHLRRLRRTGVGPWTLDDAVALDAADPTRVLPPVAAVRGMPACTVGSDILVAVGHGAVLDRAVLDVEGDGPWAVVDEKGDLAAVYRGHGQGRAKPTVVLAG